MKSCEAAEVLIEILCLSFAVSILKSYSFALTYLKAKKDAFKFRDPSTHSVQLQRYIFILDSHDSSARTVNKVPLAFIANGSSLERKHWVKLISTGIIQYRMVQPELL